MTDKSFELSSRAMLANLTVSNWTARKLDKRITNETNQRHNAASDAGRYNKALVSKTALAEITKIVSEARTTYLSLTLPWQDGGQRLLPAKAYVRFTEKMRQLRWDFEREVELFVSNYQTHIDRAKVTLGDIFDPTDYPTENDIRDKFAFNTSVMPMPDADDFRVSLSADLLENVRTEIKGEIEAKAKTAHNDIVDRITSVLTTMADKLKGYDPEQAVGVFRDSLVGNVATLAEILPELNVTEDARIEQLAADMKALAAVDADDLRGDKPLRDSTAAEASRLAELAASYLS